MKSRRVEARFDDGKSDYYRKVCTNSVLCLVLGIASIMSFFGFWWLMIPIAASVFGWLALDKISRKPRDLSGVELTKVGMTCAAFFAGASIVMQIISAAALVPWGYEVIDYNVLQPEIGRAYSLQAEKLDGKLVYIEGYMETARQTTGLKKFFTCPVIGHCTFCIPSPKPTERIEIKLTGDMRTSYKKTLIRIGGILKVRPENPTGTPYIIEADYLR